MIARLVIVAGGCFALGLAAQPAPKKALKAKTHRVADRPLTANESKSFDSAAQCGVDMDACYGQVRYAVGTATSWALTFLDAVTAAITKASDSLASAQRSASAAMSVVGIDDSSLADLVDAVSAKVNTSLTAVDEAKRKLEATLADILREYRAKVDSISDSLAEAVSSAEEAAAAGTEKEGAAAAANKTLRRRPKVLPTYLRQQSAFVAGFTRKHTAEPSSFKSDALKAIEKINSTADEVIEMLSHINTTVLSALGSDVIDMVNSSAQSMQRTLLSGLDKMPANAPAQVRAQLSGIFAWVFAAIDAAGTDKVNEDMSPPVYSATQNVVQFQGCLQPLGDMVAELDAAWPMACGWPMLLALAAVSMSRSVLQ